MLDQVDWNKYGVVDGVARDPRCENCMVHCGYDPSGALSSHPGDTWKNLRYNFSARPQPSRVGSKVDAFNGFSIGKGHLAEAKAAINSGAAPARSMFQPGPAKPACDSGDHSQREDLLAKIAAKKPQ